MVNRVVKVWVFNLRVPFLHLRCLMRGWMEKAWASIMDDKLHSAIQRAIGMKLSSSSS